MTVIQRHKRVAPGTNPLVADPSIAKNWTNKQLYQKGTPYGVQAGIANDIDIKLSGTARFFWGLAVYMDLNFLNEMDTISLSINEDKVLDKVIWWNLNPQGAVGNIFKGEQFFYLPRLLYGTDSVVLTWNAISAKNVNIVCWTSNDVEGTPTKPVR